MDALYLFCHSRANDLEIRYSLRSLAKNLSFIRKVWIFGSGAARGGAAFGETPVIEEWRTSLEATFLPKHFRKPNRLLAGPSDHSYIPRPREDALAPAIPPIV